MVVLTRTCTPEADRIAAPAAPVGTPHPGARPTADDPDGVVPDGIRLVDAGPTCNIGPAELRRRRRSAIMIGGILAVAVVAQIVGLLPAWTAPLLAPLAGGTAAAVLQVRMRFCVAFGLAGVVGMGEDPGSMAADAALRAPHRRRALTMVVASAVVTVAWAVVAFLVVAAVG